MSGLVTHTRTRTCIVGGDFGRPRRNNFKLMLVMLTTTGTTTIGVVAALNSNEQRYI
jgi:hypothetical protein